MSLPQLGLGMGPGMGTDTGPGMDTDTGMGMDTDTDTTLGVIPTLGYLSAHPLFFCLLLLLDSTITGLIPLIMVITNRVIAFGFRDIGNIERLPMVGKRSGFLVTGSGDRIDKETLRIRRKESRPQSDFGRLSHC